MSPDFSIREGIVLGKPTRLAKVRTSQTGAGTS
jgi:hypothetical protein